MNGFLLRALFSCMVRATISLPVPDSPSKSTATSVRATWPILPASTHEIHTIVVLAEKELSSGHKKNAADLLRAAEHLSFAALAETDTKKATVSEELETIISEEMGHLTEKANEHWGEEDESDRHVPVTALFRDSLEKSAQALDEGAYRKALELVRGAEALAHVKKHGPNELEGGKDQPKLLKP